MTPGMLVKMLQDQANLAAAWLELRHLQIELQFAEEEARSHRERQSRGNDK
jgi:hypothetical protein